MLNVVIIVVVIVLGGYLAFSKRVGASSDWQATVTPLASIMGSGFLVSAPLLAGIVGNLALVMMTALLVLAFLVGGAIRFNIQHFEPIENDPGVPQKVAYLSRMVLAAGRPCQPIPRSAPVTRRCTCHAGRSSGSASR